MLIYSHIRSLSLSFVLVHDFRVSAHVYPFPLLRPLGVGRRSGPFYLAEPHLHCGKELSPSGVSSS